MSDIFGASPATAGGRECRNKGYSTGWALTGAGNGFPEPHRERLRRCGVGASTEESAGGRTHLLHAGTLHGQLGAPRWRKPILPPTLGTGGRS